MMSKPLTLSLVAICAPVLAAAAPVFQFPQNAAPAFEASQPRATIQLAVGPFLDGNVAATVAEGSIRHQVWKTPRPDADTLSLIAPLRDQLKRAGFSILYECATRGCGGFDFRFNTDVVAEPDMHVDLGDFRYLVASAPDDIDETFISLLVSRSPEQGFVQVITVSKPTDAQGTVSLSTKSISDDPAEDGEQGIAGLLVDNGSAVLEGLEFGKGSADLSGHPASSLQELATFLTSHPNDLVVLVGHTDATGSLKRNVELSRERAVSVMNRLIASYGVNSDQLSAEGVGFLSPRATNATPEGRDRNRRVEVVLTSGH